MEMSQQNNMNEVVRVAENFYSDLYSDTNEQEEEGRERETVSVEVFSFTTDEVRNVLIGKT